MGRGRPGPWPGPARGPGRPQKLRAGSWAGAGAARKVLGPGQGRPIKFWAGPALNENQIENIDEIE